jgi:Protein of unknown function (DUF3426)
VGERRSAIIISATIVVLIGLALIFGVGYLGRDEAASEPLTEVTDAAAIQNQIQLSHLSIATSENYAGQRIRVISGYLKNTSDKLIRTVDVKLVFTDYEGKPIHEYSERVLRQNERPLAAGEEFQFEIRQENLPRTWNYRVPITEVTKIGF